MGNCRKVQARRWGVVHQRSEREVWKTTINGWEAQDFKVGFGNRLKFWKDKWCGDTPLRDSFSDFYSIACSKDAWVVDV